MVNQRHGGLVLTCVLAVASGCGDDEGGGGGGSGGAQSACGTTQAPLVLTLRDVTPAAGTTVSADGIVHAFTVVSAPALFQNFTFLPDASHTAGQPDPPSLSIVATTEGDDIHYEVSPVSWSSAPATVSLSVQERYETDEGCVYAFPEPLFSYSIEPGAGGAGGTGTGGAGGAGAGGAGTGGAGGA